MRYGRYKKSEPKNNCSYLTSGRYQQDIEEWERLHPNTKYIIDEKKYPIR